jgi:hypothetical protein
VLLLFPARYIVRTRPALTRIAARLAGAQGRLVYCGNDTECALLILAGQVLPSPPEHLL